MALLLCLSPCLGGKEHVCSANKMAALMNSFAFELLRRKQNQNRQKVSGEARRFGARAPLPIPQKEQTSSCHVRMHGLLLCFPKCFAPQNSSSLRCFAARKIQDSLQDIFQASGVPARGLQELGDQAASVAQTALKLFKEATAMGNAWLRLS